MILPSSVERDNGSTISNERSPHFKLSHQQAILFIEELTWQKLLLWLEGYPRNLIPISSKNTISLDLEFPAHLGLLMAQGFTIIIAAPILSSTANAITIRLNQGGTFTDENGAVAVSGGTIQIIRGSPQAPANTGDFLNPGEVFLSLRAGVDPAAPAIPLTLDSGLIKRDEIGYAAGSVIGILDVTNGTTIYLRIW